MVVVPKGVNDEWKKMNGYINFQRGDKESFRDFYEAYADHAIRTP